MRWIRNTNGKKDAALTLMIVSFFICLVLSFVGSVEKISFGSANIFFRAFDIGFATTVLLPLIALYFGRRYTDIYYGFYDNRSRSNNKGLQQNDIPEIKKENKEMAEEEGEVND